jgi:hypothetical protein
VDQRRRLSAAIGANQLGATLPDSSRYTSPTMRRSSLGVALALCVLGTACNPDDPNSLSGSSGSGGQCETSGPGATTSSGVGGDASSSSSGAGGGEAPDPTILDQRKLDYHEALRTASLKLVNELPTMEQLRSLSDAVDQEARYAELVGELMENPRFKLRMIDFWRNELRIGGTPARETAPAFAARITVEGRPYTDLFTAETNTCPTFNGTDFVDGSCTNATPTAGVLTNPGLLAHYDGNMAFRRVRFYQEVFSCRRQPSEFSATPIPMGAGDYTAPWPFDSIAGASNGGRIDFLDTSSAICANCHATANRRAPLFAYFDANGVQQATIQVRTPVEGVPLSVMGDWLPPGQEQPAYKLGEPASNLLEMGQRMAADPEVQACGVIRLWNFAMSKGDVVNDAAVVPTVVIEDLIEEFELSGFNQRELLHSIFTHPDFVRF